MSRPGLVALSAVVGLLLGAAASAPAQGLGDAAAQERQKREAKKAKDEGRVYSNDDLPKPDPEAAKKKGAARPAEPAPAPPAGGEEGSTGDDAASVFAARKQRIADAEAAVSEARAEVEKIEARVQQLQAMLNPMSPTYIYGSATSGDMAGAEARARQELQQSEARLTEARKALAAANHDLEDAQLGRMPSPRP